MAKEVHNFRFGFGESIRYILYYIKQEFKDIGHDITTGPNEELKESTLLHGHLPLFKEDDKILYLSRDIAKYVAKGTGLIPADPCDQTFIENIVHIIYDFWDLVHAYTTETDPEEKRKIKKKLLEESIDYFFSKFEQNLKDNDGYFNRKLTWAEFLFCGLVETTDLILGIELEKKYPTVLAVVEKIRNLPGVKEYIATRGPYKLPNKLEL